MSNESTAARALVIYTDVMEAEETMEDQLRALAVMVAETEEERDRWHRIADMNAEAGRGD